MSAEVLPSSPAAPIKMGRAPLDPPSPPKTAVPEGACDCHLHMFAGADEFARDPTRLEDPAEGSLDDWIGRLRRQMAVLGLSRAVLVQSIVYREDNGMLCEALSRLGPDTFRGVGLVGPDVSAAELASLHAAGVRGIRCNARHPGALLLSDLEALAPRLADTGFHVQILFGDGQDIAAEADRLARLPVPVVIDHHASPGEGAIDAGAPPDALKRLLDGGNTYVKLSAAYRMTPPPHTALAAYAANLFACAPQRIVWGSDWPYVLYNGPVADAGVLLDAVCDALPDEAARRSVFVDTPKALYGF
ncbi:MAG: amidohydrolase family protein [Pseudomonadota bacterium]